MKAIILASLLASVHSPGLQTKEISAAAPVRVAMMCFKTGEETSGMTKICYYNCGGSRAAITIGAVSLCPLTIDQ